MIVVLLSLACVCLFIAAVGGLIPHINLTAAGLALWALSQLLSVWGW
jgi:hypothetical protein